MLEEMDKAYVLHTYARNYVNFVRGENATLEDADGKKYIDFTSGIGVVSVGHANPVLSEAICAQAGKIIHISNLFLIEPQARLAKKLVDLSGYDMRLFFANSGAEANEGAIKIARKYGEVDGRPKRYKVITLEHSFHGRTISTLKATGQESMHHYFGPYPDGFVYASEIDEIEKLIDDHTVAVMIELIQGEGGVEPQDKSKVQALAKMLKERDVLLIVDEVQTGIYRTGELLASNLYEIEPDIVTVAKGLGGGVPIGAVMTRLKEIFEPGDHGSTFGGNYLVTVAAQKVIEILEAEKNSGVLDEMMLYFSGRLERLVRKYPAMIDKAVGIGLMRGVRIKNSGLLASILSNAFDEGVLLLKAGRNTLRFLPPLTITRAEAEEGFARLERAMEKTAAGAK
ncbi:MAG: aspartate aminotransferase family protein [Campylobacteraceae bacterium 4484_4]|nr:MAG: aspartate aminotransferase family protein [Campylobacteraceae bacterium 4484_4]